MFNQNKDAWKKRWEGYRRVGKVKFIILFSIYFSLILSIVNFLLEYMAYGIASSHMAVIRFITNLIISPFMAWMIWNVSEKKYQKQ